MREKLLSVIAIIFLLFTGCSDETEEYPASSEDTVIWFTTEGNVNTRIGGTPQIDGYHLRYILEVYKQNEDGTSGELLERLCQAGTKFQLKLENDCEYILAAWADYVNSGADNTQLDNLEDEFYITTAGLGNVSMRSAKWGLSTSAKDAFCTVKKGFDTTESGLTLTLKRPLAMLNLLGEQHKKDCKSITVNYPKIYTAYNVLKEDVAGTATEQTVAAAVYSGDDRLAFDYLFVHPLADATKYEQGSSLYDMEICFFATDEVAETPFSTYRVEYVPFSPNYRTNLSCLGFPTGGGSDGMAQVNISIDAEYETPELTNPQSFLVSSYIRTSFYETNRIDTKSLQTCNDLIYLVANPYLSGDLYFEIPENHAGFANVVPIATFEGRNCVIAFDGNSEMNAGGDLLHKVRVTGVEGSGDFPTFTFGTWIYVDEWETDAHIFKKSNESNVIGLKLGANEGELVFYVDDKSFTSLSPALKIKGWHHIAITHNGNQKKSVFYVDGQAVKEETTSIGKLPFLRAPMHIGCQFKGKLDETFFNMLALSAGEINAIKDSGLNFSNWNHTKTLAYWKYDDVTDLGKDSHSWITIMNQIRPKLAGKDIKFRLGLSSGDWKGACKKANRDNLAKSIRRVLENYKFDGVDLDFEWPENQTELDDYSATILKIKETLGDDFLFSVSLHPYYYGINQEAVNAVDWISLQCYGPSKEEFPYDKYEQHLQTVINYGMPAGKLVAGLPFYGTAGKGIGTAAYYDFVKDGLITDPAVDDVTYKGNQYIINGQTTIRKKVEHARNLHLLGVMSWDLATDCTYDNPWSLQRTVVEAVWK